MATSITIRDVPEGVRDELAARAARAGRSLQEHLRRELIAMASRPDPETFWTRVGARTAATGSRVSADAILAARDADRA